MRYAERFLVAFTLFSLVLRFAGVKDSIVLELISMPVLALFYLVGLSFVIKQDLSLRNWNLKWWEGMIAFLCGLVMAYCTISLLFYTLQWIPKRDMLENCSLFLGLLLIGCSIGWRKNPDSVYQQILIRGVFMLAIILLAAVPELPFIMTK